MTDKPISDEETRAALEVCDKATPGPWEYDLWIEDTETGKRAFALTSKHRNMTDPITYFNDNAQEHDDAKFIALARTLLPRTLREVQRLRKVLRSWSGDEIYQGVTLDENMKPTPINHCDMVEEFRAALCGED